MANRCLNKVMLIGNLTRDPELRYTPQGVAVCSFGIATNRRWTTQSGDQKEDAQFHRIVAWNKLAELCSQLLVKGSRAYLEGRLQYREWTGNDNVVRKETEIVIEDMVVLDSKAAASTEAANTDNLDNNYDPSVYAEGEGSEASGEAAASQEDRESVQSEDVDEALSEKESAKQNSKSSQKGKTDDEQANENQSDEDDQIKERPF